MPTCSAIASTGLDISYETIRSWVLKFGPVSRDGYEGVVIGRLTDGIWARSWSGSPASGCALWRAVDHEGEVLDILVPRRRNTRSARRRTINEYRSAGHQEAAVACGVTEDRGSRVNRMISACAAVRSVGSGMPRASLRLKTTNLGR